jgi:hypothetical protein
MRKHIYFTLMFFIIFLDGYIVSAIHNYWIELLVFPIVCGGAAGWLFSQALKECREETRDETRDEMILLALEQMLKDAETKEEIEERDEQL